MGQSVQLLYALAVLAAFVLVFFGARLITKGGKDRLRGGLMIGAALVTLLNVYLYSRPLVP
jgi:hypothetical protein